MTSFIDDFISRGYLYQSSDLDTLRSLLQNEKVAGYVGFDCTAKSLHVGSLMQIMIMRLLQQHGHKPIIIVGGATTKIGDPTGKDEARKVLTGDDIKANMDGIKKSLSKFINFGDKPTDAILLDNSNWLEHLNYIDFLRDYGKLFSVNRMLTMDSVKLRLDREQPLSFLEFNYMLLQSYDFYHLNKTHNCVLQFGGSDQWGNIVMGVDFTRKLTGNQVYGITTPLLTTSSGAKMGKSINGAIWLNEDMLSPYDYYQYWRNVEDLDVIRFAKFFAEFNESETVKFEILAKNDINQAKKQLAFTLTKLCHGEQQARNAQDAAQQLFEQGGISVNMPSIDLEVNIFVNGIQAYELFFMAGLASSKSESRKLIRGNGAKINDQAVLDENTIVNSSHIKDGVIKLSSGKKKHILIKILNQ